MRFYDVHGKTHATLIGSIILTSNGKNRIFQQRSVLYPKKEDNNTEKCIVMDRDKNEVVLMDSNGKVIDASAIDQELLKARNDFKEHIDQIERNIPSVETIRKLLHPEETKPKSRWERIKDIFKK